MSIYEIYNQRPRIPVCFGDSAEAIRLQVVPVTCRSGEPVWKVVYNEHVSGFGACSLVTALIHCSFDRSFEQTMDMRCGQD